MALSTPTSNGSRRFNPIPSPSRSETPRSSGLIRPTLPQKSVTSASIEDSYVSFILYCNPAVPLETDTAALREAFRTPPKSEGKSFSTFTLFELIKQLHSKELKTWAELALKLGVEPPDHDKGQSSQKIQQYAVRLKRWMHSMHINAFFDYLMDNPHPYWTLIPSDPNPVCDEGRDGVAAEDDMALRALLPHIRPRRGRKRPEDDSFSKSPSQKPRLESPNFNGEARTARPDSLDPWTAHPDGRNAFMFPPVDPRSSVLPETNSAFPWSNDVSREPMSAYPQSAMTPSTRGTFWGDPAEPRSAISPSKVRSLGRRHGAKVVSSAWRSGGVSTSGRPRGRPPSSRPSDGPLSAIPDEHSEFQTAPFEQSTSQLNTQPTPMHPPDPVSTSAGPTSAPTTAPTAASTTTPTTTTPTTRPSRPGRLSLQVPERASGPVRLATPPPPVVMVNGKSTVNGSISNGTGGLTASPIEDTSIFDNTASVFTAGPTDDPTGPVVQFEFDDSDRTNRDEMETLLVADLFESVWYDDKGQPSPPADINEALALARAIIAGLAKRSRTSEAFLIATAALAGARHLPKSSGGTNSVHRLEVDVDYTRYSYTWDLRCGLANARFRFTEIVPHARWKKGSQHRGEGADVPAEGDAAVEFWRRRYADLVHMVGRGRRREDVVSVIKEGKSGG